MSRALILVALAAVAADGLHVRDGPMETIGNAAGTVGSGVDTVTGPVTKPAGDLGSGAATTVGDGVGGAGQAAGSATGAGDNPMAKVPVVGGAFEVRGVSTALNCVVSLTIQYFVVYTALALVRTAADVWGLSYEGMPIQKILQSAATTMAFAPMLAVLLLAVRMRVTWLTQGKGDPPVWMQVWMYCTTYAILAMTLTVVVIPLFTGDVIGVNAKTGEVDPEIKPFENFILAGCMTALKYLIMIGLYVGVVCIIYGAYTFKPPAGMWPGETIPPPAPAVACTFIMSAAYFIIYALVQFARTWTQFTQQKLSKFEDAMLDSTKAMNFGPMLCVLFIGARMRALQMDPLNGAPQKWAQNCFFMCTYGVITQVLISIAVPLCFGGKVKEGKCEGDMEYEEISYPILASILSVGRWIIMICIYVGAACVIYSVFTIQHPQGEQYTPPISVTMQCVINLTFQFFFVYIGIWVGITVKEFTKLEWHFITNTMENAKGTIAYR